MSNHAVPDAPTHAVLMGDLVASEQAPAAALHAAFNAAVEAANRAMADHIRSPLTITLGDEFQGICGGLAGGLAVLRRLSADLLRRDAACRFVLGVVRLETPLNRERAWNMMGPGLAAARERLADKRDPNAYRFHLPGQGAVETLMEAVGAGLTDIERGWTGRQREIVLASADEAPAELARRLNISLQTLYKVRRAGRFELHARQWRALAHAAARLDADYGLT